MVMSKCVCGKLLKRGAKKFCCRECWLESPEMVKTWNTMSVSRNKLVPGLSVPREDNFMQSWVGIYSKADYKKMVKKENRKY